MPHSCLNTIDQTLIPDNPYLLLTPGPLSTSKRVRAALLKDWCTWDKEYNDVVQEIRSRLVALASKSGAYTAVLMQGSGTFSVESAVTTCTPTLTPSPKPGRHDEHRRRPRAAAHRQAAAHAGGGRPGARHLGGRAALNTGQ